MPEWDDPGDEDWIPTTPDKNALKQQEQLHKYNIEFLQSKIKENDPFAGMIMDSNSPDKKGYIAPCVGSEALKKLWWYKDPQNRVQGPFSSVEMFNWKASNYFPDDLPIAFKSADKFVPLRQFRK